jgi:hypothetical protein
MARTMMQRIVSSNPAAVNRKLQELSKEGWKCIHMHSYGYPFITDHYTKEVHVVTLVLEKEEDD